VLLVGGGIVAVLVAHGSGGRGRFKDAPAACSLLTQSEVRAYLPDAVSNANGTTTYCQWSGPLGKPSPGRLVVGVEQVNHDTGGVPTDADGHRQYDVRRRQADTPGTKITPVRLGDEAFLADRLSATSRQRICLVYVRVGNVVFDVEFQRFDDNRDPAVTASTLAADAVRHLPAS
jgi:hypothetical protein